MKKSLMIGLLLLMGCSSTKAIYDNYNNLVNIKDGINQKEAKIIAQRVIVATAEQRNYRLTAPDIRTDKEASKYMDYWFVVFGHNWLSPISTDPLAKTYTELKESSFLVVIDKKDGSIKFAGLWYPKRAKDFNWVFNPNDYKENDPLALPPYEKVPIR